jgi:hypothetical protein
MVLAGLVGCGSEPAEFDRAVLIVVDTLRRDHLSLYSGPARTPTIDALARRGTSLENATASFHQTTMSMAALFTGRVPALEWAPGPIPAFAFHRSTWCGMRRHWRRGDACIPPAVPTLAEQMQRSGFETLGVASNPLLHAPAGYDRGFDEWVEVGALAVFGRPAKKRTLARSRQAEEVIKAVEAVLDSRSSDRFFLYVHFMDAHDWLLAGLGSYVEGVEASDAGVAALLELLEREGLLGGALVVLTADHAEMLRRDPVLIAQQGHKGSPSFEPVLDVPLIVAPAVDLPRDRPIRTDQLAELVLGWVGAEGTPGWSSEETLAPDEAFTSELAWRTYRRGRWKSAWQRDGTAVHLFDLDRGEDVDVAALHPEIVEEHRARIDEIRAELRSHTVEAPAQLSPADLELLRALGYAD